MVPLDGGRAVSALHPVFWLAGLAGLVVLELVRPSPILPLIIIVGLFELRSRWRRRNAPESVAYYAVKPWQRVVVGVVYLGLAGLLVLGMSATHVPHSF